MLHSNRIVIKIGTSTLTNANGSLNFRVIDRLARVICGLRNSGLEVVMVSSGAIAVGVNKMRMAKRPKELRLKQAAAAVGQCELMHIYDKFFGEYGQMVAQILFNSEDVENPDKRRNLTNTFDALLENGIIPIINENDSIGAVEIESDKKLFGDNDTLSAVVSSFCGASRLIILSDIEGLYDSDPRKNPDAKLIREISRIDDSILALGHGAGTNRGTGGMITKLTAAGIATAHGADVYITFGGKPENIYDIMDGKETGTHFLTQEDRGEAT